jgi:hypothetical protein
VPAAFGWCGVTGGFEVAVDRQFAIRTQECWELLDEVRFLEEENIELRAQLAEWSAKRTLGGPPRTANGRTWSNVKFSGPTPPPYSPAIDPGAAA